MTIMIRLEKENNNGDPKINPKLIEALIKLRGDIAADASTKGITVEDYSILHLGLILMDRAVKTLSQINR